MILIKLSKWNKTKKMMENFYKKIALYSEEYTKDTTGMARVCVEILYEMNNSRLYVNYDHWLNKKWLKKYGINQAPFRLGLRGFGYKFISIEDFQKYGKVINFFIKIFKRILNLISFPLDAIFSIYSLNKIPRSTSWLIHTGGWPAGIRSRLLIIYIKLLRFNSVNLVIHNNPNTNNCFELFIWSKIVRKLCINVITVSNHTALKLKSYFPNIKVVANGIRDLFEEKKFKDKNLYFPKNNKLNLLLVSNITRFDSKGSQEVIPELLKLDHIYNIIWAGPFDKYFYKKYKQSGISNKINFIGFSSEIDKLILESDIVLIPSLRNESFSMVFLEASMLSRPCICYDSVATAELIKSNSGWVIRKKNDSLEKQLISLSNYSLNTLREYGQNARKIFLSKFTSSIMSRNYSFLLSN